MKNKRYGNIFWITGLSGSGKSAIGRNLKTYISKSYGKTIIINGDDIRNIYNLKKYSKEERLKLAKSNAALCKFIAKQKINVIFTTVALFKEIYDYNRKNLPNYFCILIKCSLKNILKRKKKIFYRNNEKNVWGFDLKPFYPSKANIIINNDFKKSSKFFSKKAFLKIKKLLPS